MGYLAVPSHVWRLKRTWQVANVKLERYLGGIDDVSQEHENAK